MRLWSHWRGFAPVIAKHVNLYSLFVERATTVVKQEGLIGLLVPSGIASDKTAAKFFKGVATEGWLKALYDFENRRTRYDLKPFFENVDNRFKFCVMVASPFPTEYAAQCAFFLQATAEIDEPERCFTLSAADFARINPNTGTAPIFRSRRDAELTKAIYAAAPILIDRSGGVEVKTWPVKYLRIFDMTNDSGLFRTRQELEDQEGDYPLGGNIYGSASGNWVLLYEGKMIQAFDHRSAGVKINPKNLNRAGQPDSSTPEQLGNPDFFAKPRFFVEEDRISWLADYPWLIAFKDITSPTNMRTMIAAAIPKSGVGNTAPLILWDDQDTPPDQRALLLGNLGAISFDYVTRQKAQSTHLNWYIVDQLPVIPPEKFEITRFESKTSAEIVREAVLELTYTAHDMAPSPATWAMWTRAETLCRPSPGMRNGASSCAPSSMRFSSTSTASPIVTTSATSI